MDGETPPDDPPGFEAGADSGVLRDATGTERRVCGSPSENQASADDQPGFEPAANPASKNQAPPAGKAPAPPQVETISANLSLAAPCEAVNATKGTGSLSLGERVPDGGGWVRGLFLLPHHEETPHPPPCGPPSPQGRGPLCVELALMEVETAASLPTAAGEAENFRRPRKRQKCTKTILKCRDIRVSPLESTKRELTPRRQLGQKPRSLHPNGAAAGARRRLPPASRAPGGTLSTD